MSQSLFKRFICLLLFCIPLLGFNTAFAQPDKPLSATEQPMISAKKCYLYYSYNDTLLVDIQTENGPWVSYYMTTGWADISFIGCGRGKRYLCQKRFRICSPVGSDNCNTVTLQRKKRYQINWNRQQEKWQLIELDH